VDRDSAGLGARTSLDDFGGSMGPSIGRRGSAYNGRGSASAIHFDPPDDAWSHNNVLVHRFDFDDAHGGWWGRQSSDAASLVQPYPPTQSRSLDL
jgi:hypothetical protein